MEKQTLKKGNKTAAIIGATGLIGSQLLKLLKEDKDFTLVKVLSRRKFDLDKGKVKPVVLDFADMQAFKTAIAGSDVVFCTVGTTMRKVKGNKSEYRKVDYDIPVNAAKYSAETGCSHFILVSSVGADSNSGNFYLKLKGEVEDRLRKMNISAISVFRPSMLLGKREESRFWESLGQYIMRPLRFIIPSRYKPVEAKDVAKAMISVSKQAHKGFRIFHYDDIMKYS